MRYKSIFLWSMCAFFGLATCKTTEAGKKSVRLLEKTVYLPDRIPVRFRLVPAGAFPMGSPADEQGRDGDEGPVHPVTISRDFYLGIYEVTQAQWEAIMGENPSVFQHTEDHLQHPVESVSWSDCQVFIDKLNRLGAGRFRLPTEAEWEYACRAGTTSRFYWGDDPKEYLVNEYGWVNSRSFATTHPVGQKKPNAWGLYDMNGNVWEWCQDWYGPYPEGPQTNPTGPSEGKGRVFRGGSWYDFPVSQRSANRHRHGTERGYTAIGLRLVWEEGKMKE